MKKSSNMLPHEHKDPKSATHLCDDPVLSQLSQKFAAEAKKELEADALLPLAAQIKSVGSLNALKAKYHRHGNAKLLQLDKLAGLAQTIEDENTRLSDSRNIRVSFGELPDRKKRQYQSHIREGSNSSWDQCFVRMYISAERAFEIWADSAKMDFEDLNEADQFDPHDYKVCGINVDVKSTLSVGRSELKTYWSPDSKWGEIICGVSCSTCSASENTSKQRIQGIFDVSCYDTGELQLNHFTLDKKRINVCYFQPPEIFFSLGRSIPDSWPDIDADVIEYCTDSKIYLNALFAMSGQDVKALLRKMWPPCQDDLLQTVEVLITTNKQHLLPHYIADYVLTAIVSKNIIDCLTIHQLLFEVFEPSEDQKRYLRCLVRAGEVLHNNNFRCAHHHDENVGEMDIEVIWEKKVILRARCCRSNANLSTTFLSYSWKTGETLVYGDHGIEICDADGCGCLTHLHDGERIGKRSCPKYGEKT